MTHLLGLPLCSMSTHILPLSVCSSFQRPWRVLLREHELDGVGQARVAGVAEAGEHLQRLQDIAGVAQGVAELEPVGAYPPW